jgi:hypothetical protein
MSRLIGVLALVALACGACGGDAQQTPAGPSSGAGTSSVTQGAKILGNVSVGQPLAAMAAQVVGTSISSPVNPGGGFSLDNVPAGAVQLRFVGSGVDASVGLSPVQSGDVVSVLVGVSGATATIQAESRNAGGKIELEGRIEALPTDPAKSLVVAGRTVTTTDQTMIRDGNNAAKAFEDLVIGQRVHVKGTLVTDPVSAIAADSILIQNTNTWIPVNVNGIVESLGEPPLATDMEFSFQIGSRIIQGDEATKFFGEDDVPADLEDLKNGQRVEVKGELRDGFVYAFRIHISGLSATPNPPQDDSASVEGIVMEKSVLDAEYPTLYLDTKFGEVKVTTTSATVVQRRGSVVDFKALDIGQTVHAVGTRLNDADKTLEAKFLQIKDDATDGRFVIDGSLGGLKGMCPSISFGVNGYTVKADGDTEYLPDTPAPGLQCTDLKNGMKVGVEGGRQADGSVLATTVTKK